MKLTPLPTYGTHMTLKSFIEHCESGGFIDYDGHGYYATKTKISNKVVIPSDITGKYSEFNMKTGKFIKKTKVINIDKSFTYVMWFNK